MPQELLNVNNYTFCGQSVMAPRKLTNLTLQRKAKIIEESQTIGFDHREACEKYGIGKATLSRMLSNKESILRCVDSSKFASSPKVRKRQKLGQLSDLEVKIVIL